MDYLNPTVPIQSWRNGDFSDLLPNTVIYDPLTKQPFAGNIIPADRISSVSKGMQEKYYPLPNYGDPNVFANSNYRETKTRPWDAPWLSSARIDQHFSANDFVFGRFTLTGGPSNYWEDNLPTIGQHHQYRTTRSASFSYTHVFSPTVFNEGRWGMDYNNIPSNGPVRGQEEVKRLGLVGLAPNLPDVPGMLEIYWNGIGLQQLQQTNGSNPGFRNHNEHFQDHLSWFRGRHTLRFGLDMTRAEGDQMDIPYNLFGAAVFSSRFTSGGIQNQGFPYADFLLGIPTSSHRAYPPLLIEMNRWQYAGYVADEFKVNQTLTLTLGLRYQLHQPWRENQGRLAMFDVNNGSIVVPDKGMSQITPLFPLNYVNVVAASKVGLPSDTLINTDKNDFAPRIGAAWRPFGANTVLRAGYGVFYDIVPFSMTTAFSPFQLSESWYTNPENNPQVIFPRVYPDTTASGYSQVSLPSSINPNLRTPWSQQYNVTIERQQWNTGFRASYIGTAQRQGTYSYDYNSPIPNDQPYISKARPFPQYPGISYRTNGAGHQYNSLSTEVKRSMAKGLQAQLAWTWARDRYDLSRWDSLENPFDRHREVAVAPDVPTHRVTANWIYELPFGKGRHFGGNMSRWTDLVVGGWMISGAYVYDSGQFLTPYWSGPDPTGTAYTDSTTAPWVTIRPDQIGNPNLPSDQRSITNWFNAAAFTAPQAGQFGNAAKGTIKGPSSSSLNAGVQKSFNITEKGPRVTMEMTARNALNHPNWSNPSTNISDSYGVGHIYWAGGIGESAGERECRLGLRVEW